MAGVAVRDNAAALQDTFQCFFCNLAGAAFPDKETVLQNYFPDFKFHISIRLVNDDSVIVACWQNFFPLPCGIRVGILSNFAD